MEVKGSVWTFVKLSSRPNLTKVRLANPHRYYLYHPHPPLSSYVKGVSHPVVYISPPPLRKGDKCLSLRNHWDTFVKLSSNLDLR